MTRALYSFLFYLALPFAVLRLFWRSRAEPLYRATLGQRFGRVQVLPPEARPIWVHAVSAGETNAAAKLIEQLIARGHKVFVTTMTPTGRARVQALFADRVYHSYAPWDVPHAVNRFLDRVQPCALVIVDTELWPNMLAGAHRRGIPALLVNARLSERSASGYARIPSITGEMMANLSAVACQTPAQGDRFLALGLPPDKLHVAGSIKFDVELPAGRDDALSAIRRKIGQRFVVLGASTHRGEESALIEAVEALSDPSALLVLAPRHPNRNDEVASLCAGRGLGVVRHSEGDDCTPETRVLLVDTMGELMDFYRCADVAFVGGSLVPVGGHNPMEPALARVPIVMGRYQFNIDEIADRFVEADAMIVVDDDRELAETVGRLRQDEMRRDTLRRNATGVMEKNRGALDRVLTLVSDILSGKSSLK